MEGFRIDPDVLVDTQQRIIGEGAKKQAQYAAAVDQLLAENRELHQQLIELEKLAYPEHTVKLTEVEEESG